MPSAYVGGLATAQASGQNNQGLGARPAYDAGPGKSFTPETPWSNYSYAGNFMGGYGPNAVSQSGGAASGHLGPAPEDKPRIGEYSYDNNGGTGYYMSGPQGLGVYRQSSPERQLMDQQAYNTKKFVADMPTTADQLGNQTGGSISAQMGQGIQNTRQQDSRRGLLYGGVNQGREQGMRGQAAAQTAQSRSSINSGLIQEGQKMQSQAAYTGISYQQMQQSLNNAVYENAMKSFAANGAVAGDIMGSVGAIFGAIYGGSAGAEAGYAGGKATGNALS